MHTSFEKWAALDGRCRLAREALERELTEALGFNPELDLPDWLDDDIIFDWYDYSAEVCAPLDFKLPKAAPAKLKKAGIRIIFRRGRSAADLLYRGD